MKFPFLSIESSSTGSPSIDWPVRLGLMVALHLLAACEAVEPVVAVSGKTMGTTWEVRVVSDDLNPVSLKQDIDARLVALNRVFSTYLPDSELSVLNRTTGPVGVSEELGKVLGISAEIHRLSDGAFDVTVGTLVNLWGFGPDGPRRGVPGAAEIAVAMSRVGFSRLVMADREVTRPEGLMLDFSAIAKGYAVDVVAGLLEQQGAARYLVEIGGEVKTSGLNARNQPWIIGIEAPDMGLRRLYGRIPVTDQGMATSGDYRNFFRHEGQVYSHTLDPATGWPVSHNLASVTVLHESTAFADGLATAFSVLGPERTLAIAEANNFKVFAIIRNQGAFESVTSSAMKDYLKSRHPPGGYQMTGAPQ